MSDPLFEGDDEANTPVTVEEREQLIPSYITLRTELNEAEQINITDAMRWAARARGFSVLDDAQLRELHRRMFGDVWKWAGTYRKTARNIGIEAHQIAVAVKSLVDDAAYWIEHETFAPDEAAVRFSHRLVFIHPFPNGNGRWSRIAGDLLAVRLGQRPFSWGGASLVDAGETRKAYIKALQKADQDELGPLLEFARS
jgi:Fic-DOC domain mobile mystery protein B